MTEYEFTIRDEPVIYINCSSYSKELLEQVEKAVTDVLKENYPHWRIDND